MTASAHSHYNYNRRNSSTSPYTILSKHQHQNQHQQQQMAINAPYGGNNTNSHTGGPVSSSVPTLSREFVVRRISEGETGRLKEELKCEACGKGYKHISSLAKHLWEHTPEWNVTKKLLISKHQQVQLLEAASILVGMNENSTSRRNSVFQEEEDPKYPTPFSPIPDSESKGEHAGINADSYKQKEGPTFKPSFKGPATNENFDPNNGIKINFDRSHSISQYPPASDYPNSYKGTSPMNGGYLDNTVGRNFNRANSISANGQNAYEGLKSPPSSYKNSQLAPTSYSSSSSPKKTSSPVNESSIKEDEADLEEESVIGKMED